MLHMENAQITQIPRLGAEKIRRETHLARDVRRPGNAILNLRKSGQFVDD